MTSGGGIHIALSSRVRSYKRRYDLEYCDECVWVEIPLDGFNFFIGNHYEVYRKVPGLGQKKKCWINLTQFWLPFPSK
jgi:hypothetical protein